jgi:hypothetical protein
MRMENDNFMFKAIMEGWSAGAVDRKRLFLANNGGATAVSVV